jgi:hypothetical protein
MELREIFRPGWRMIAAVVALFSGPLSVLETLWIAHLVASGQPVPASLGALSLYTLPTIAVVALTSLYFGEVARTRELEREVGRRPSHRSYVREAPAAILDRLEKADWKELRHSFRSRYRGRWIEGQAVISSISEGYFWQMFVYLADDLPSDGYPRRPWGVIIFLRWAHPEFDQLQVGDRVTYEGRIAEHFLGNLRLKHARITLISPPKLNT